jgi:hypothetical protein
MVAGVVSFESGACQAYYALLMKSPGAALPGQSAVNYRRLLGEACGVAPALLALEASAASVAPALIDMDPIVGDDGHVPILSDDMPLLALVGGHDPAPLTPILGDGGVEPLLHAELEPALDEPIVGEHLDDAPPLNLFGVRVKIERHYGPLGEIIDEGLRVSCNNAAHHHSKYRCKRIDIDVWGPRSAEYYLGCWLLHSGMDSAAHKAFRPSRSQMRDYIAVYGY